MVSVAPGGTVACALRCGCRLVASGRLYIGRIAPFATGDDVLRNRSCQRERVINSPIAPHLHARRGFLAPKATVAPARSTGVALGVYWIPVTSTECVYIGAILSLVLGCGARDGLWDSTGTGVDLGDARDSGVGGGAMTLGGLGGKTQASPVVQGCGPSAATCLDSEYCSYSLGSCRSTTDFGSCTARPTQCSDRYMPVCGCDGQRYDNSCLARASGADLATNGACVAVRATAGGWLPCGASSAVNPELAYCEISQSAIDQVVVFNAPLLPPACVAEASSGAASCDCFPKDTPCLEGCAVSRIGHSWAFTLVCSRPR